MIEILGVNSGQEYEAAVHLRKQMLKLWPDLAQSKDDMELDPEHAATATRRLAWHGTGRAAA